MNNLPSFSIIIPTHNRPQRLVECLRALIALDYPADKLEVVVVDDGSSDSLAKVIQPFENQINVQLVVQRQSGPAAARNHGASKAQGRFLAFTDDDVAPKSDWLRRLADRLREQPDALVGGRTINALEDNICSVASQFLIDYIYDWLNSDKKNARFFTSNNMAISADAFREFDGFDTSFVRAAAEDREFCQRWRDQGGQLIYIPKAEALHSHSLSLRSFVRQHFNYGRGAFQFHRGKANRNMGLANRKTDQDQPNSLAFCLKLFQDSFSRSGHFIRMPILMFVSQAANALGYYYARFITRNSPTVQEGTSE